MLSAATVLSALSETRWTAWGRDTVEKAPTLEPAESPLAATLPRDEIRAALTSAPGDTTPAASDDTAGDIASGRNARVASRHRRDAHALAGVDDHVAIGYDHAWMLPWH